MLKDSLKVNTFYIGVAAFLVSVISSVNADNSSQLKAWKPNPAVLSQLSATRTTIGKYSFRTPINVYPVTVPPDIAAQSQSQGVVNHMFMTTTRDADSSCVMVFGIFTPPAAAGDAPPLNAAVTMVAKGLTQHWQNAYYSPPEQGTINGLKFARCYYKGYATNSQGVVYLAHGLSYTTFDGNSLVSIEAEAPEPSNATNLPLVEASAMTLQKSNN